MTYIAKPVKMNIYVKLNLHMLVSYLLELLYISELAKCFTKREELCTNENTSTPWVRNINDFKQGKCQMTNHILHFNWKMIYDIHCETS